MNFSTEITMKVYFCVVHDYTIYSNTLQIKWQNKRDILQISAWNEHAHNYKNTLVVYASSCEHASNSINI